MAQLSEWFAANRLSLNLNKTCYSVFGTKQRITTQLKLYISGKEIQTTESCKYLGIFIDCELKWQTHIYYVHNELLKFTGIFYKIGTKLPEDILKMIYFAFVHSQLLYGIEVYANTTPNHLSKLITLNNKLLRILQKESSRSHSAELYKTYNILPVQLLHNFQILTFMHKYVHHKVKLRLYSVNILMKINKLISVIHGRKKIFIPML